MYICAPETKTWCCNTDTWVRLSCPAGLPGISSSPPGSFNPFSSDPLPAYPKKQLVLKIISGQQLPKPPDSMLGDRGEVRVAPNSPQGNSVASGLCVEKQDLYFRLRFGIRCM